MTDTAQRRTKDGSQEPEYPTSDGKPMAETDLHRKLMVYFIEALEGWFSGRPDVYVSGNNFLYWERGNPRAAISPDTYVIFGVPMRRRDCYKAWEEGGKLPDVVFEFTSKKTRREDVHKKWPLYERTLRVPEYFLFDPTGDYVRPRLRGFRLEGGEYVPLEVVDGRLHSERLGLDLVQEGEWLRIYDPAGQRWLLTPAEEARARTEAERARSEAERARSEAERALGEEVRARSEAETARTAAEEEAGRLRAELDAMRRRLGES